MPLGPLDGRTAFLDDDAAEKAVFLFFSNRKATLDQFVCGRGGGVFRGRGLPRPYDRLQRLAQAARYIEMAALAGRQNSRSGLVVRAMSIKVKDPDALLAAFEDPKLDPQQVEALFGRGVTVDGIVRRFLNAASMHPDLFRSFALAQPSWKGNQVSYRSGEPVTPTKDQPTHLPKADAGCATGRASAVDVDAYEVPEGVPLPRDAPKTVFVSMRPCGTTAIAEPPQNGPVELDDYGNRVFSSDEALADRQKQAYRSMVSLADAATASSGALAVHLARMVESGVLPTDLRGVDAKDLPNVLWTWAAVLRDNQPGAQRYLDMLEGVGGRDEINEWTRKLEDTPENTKALKSFIAFLCENIRLYDAGEEPTRRFGHLGAPRDLGITVGPASKPLPYDRIVLENPDPSEVFRDPELARDLEERLRMQFGSCSDLMRALDETKTFALSIAQERAQGLIPKSKDHSSILLRGPAGSGKSTAARLASLYRIATGAWRGIVDPTKPEEGLRPVVLLGNHIFATEQSIPLPVLYQQAGFATIYEELGTVLKLTEMGDTITSEAKAALDIILQACGENGKNGAVYIGYGDVIPLLKRDDGVKRRLRADEPTDLGSMDLPSAYRALTYRLSLINDQRRSDGRVPLFAKKSDLFSAAAFVVARGGSGNFDRVVECIENAERRVTNDPEPHLRNLAPEKENGRWVLALDLATLHGVDMPVANDAFMAALDALTGLPDLGGASKAVLETFSCSWLGYLQQCWEGLPKELADAFDRGQISATDLAARMKVVKPQENLVVYSNVDSDRATFEARLHEVLAAAGRWDDALKENRTDVTMNLVSPWQGMTDDIMFERVANAQTATLLQEKTGGGGTGDQDAKQRVDFLNGVANVCRAKREGTLKTLLLLSGSRGQVDSFQNANDAVRAAFRNAPRVSFEGIDRPEDVMAFAHAYLDQIGLELPANWKDIGFLHLKRMGKPAKLIDKVLMELYAMQGGAVGAQRIMDFLDNVYHEAAKRRFQLDGQFVPREVRLEDVVAAFEQLEIPKLPDTDLFRAIASTFKRQVRRPRAHVVDSRTRAILRNEDSKTLLALKECLMTLLLMTPRARQQVHYDDERIFTPEVKAALESVVKEVYGGSVNLGSGLDGNALLGLVRKAIPMIDESAGKILLTKISSPGEAYLESMKRDAKGRPFKKGRQEASGAHE